MHIASGVAVLLFIAAWLTHVAWTAGQVDKVKFVIGIVGIVASPVGAAHGVYLWFQQI